VFVGQEPSKVTEWAHSKGSAAYSQMLCEQKGIYGKKVLLSKKAKVERQIQCHNAENEAAINLAKAKLHLERAIHAATRYSSLFCFCGW
jgi:hypothetical protein